MANIQILSSNAGELSPKVDARSDTEKYQSGCRKLENFIPEIYGCATRRPGLKFMYKCEIPIAVVIEEGGEPN